VTHAHIQHGTAISGTYPWLELAFRNETITILPNFMIDLVALPLHIQAVPGSNFGQDTGYPA
jgi:hypothetical protein